MTQQEYEGLAMEYSRGSLTWTEFRWAVIDALTKEKEGGV